MVHFCFSWSSCINTTSAFATSCSFRFTHFTALYFLGLCHSFGPRGCSGKEHSVLERGALWEPEEGNFVWVFQDLGRGVWVKHTRCAGMKTIMSVFVVHSYLGFGLKAARLATLGALDMEGMFIPRSLKRHVDLALCQQPISCVSSLLYPVLFYVSYGIYLSENNYHLLRCCLVTAAFPCFWVQPAVTLKCKFQKCTCGNTQTPWPATNTQLYKHPKKHKQHE